MKLLVTRTRSGWEARLSDGSMTTFGTSPENAVGNLVLTNHARFGIEAVTYVGREEGEGETAATSPPAPDPPKVPTSLFDE